jgi:hypothetical protein
VNRLALSEEAHRWHHQTVRYYRDLDRKAEASGLRPLKDFANLDDTPDALEKFRRKHPGFEPFEIVDAEGKRASGLSPRFHSMLLAWRDLLRGVWRGQARGWELDTLLGLNPAAFGPWTGPRGDDPVVGAWNAGLKEAHDAGFHFAPHYPVIRAHWDRSCFSYESGEAFQNAVYALWRKRWRARVCRLCDTYFIARKAAQWYCSRFCFQEGKNERNRQWWRERGLEWRKDFLKEKTKAEARARRESQRKGGKPDGTL